MNFFNQPLHLTWIILVMVNFLIQIAYFYKDKNKQLFLAKKITTPLLLFLGLLIIIIDVKNIQIIPVIILGAMALGEMGIEGSNIVESSDDENIKTPVTVILAGVLFLLVNVFIGIILLLKINQLSNIITGFFIAIVIIVSILLLLFKFFDTNKETKTQIILYSIGLIILFAGTIGDIFSGISHLGKAALILSISDMLVLIRMGASQKKESLKGFYILLAFLISILLLYYTYIALIIKIGKPVFLIINL